MKIFYILMFLSLWSLGLVFCFTAEEANFGLL